MFSVNFTSSTLKGRATGFASSPGPPSAASPPESSRIVEFGSPSLRAMTPSRRQEACRKPEIIRRPSDMCIIAKPSPSTPLLPNRAEEAARFISARTPMPLPPMSGRTPPYMQSQDSKNFALAAEMPASGISRVAANTNAVA